MGLHVPLAQRGVPCGVDGQVVVQLPQWSMSVCVSTQAPPQSVVVPKH